MKTYKKRDMDLNLSNLKVVYDSKEQLRMPFKVGESKYCFYYHKELDAIHCNCSVYETENNLKQVRACVVKHLNIK